MTDKDKILESGLLEQYVLGLLSPIERRQVEGYVKQYPELREHIKALQDTMEAIAKQHSIEPPDGLKRDILSEIDKLDAPKQTIVNRNGAAFSRRFRIAIWSVAAVLLGAFGALAVIFYLQKDELQEELSSVQGEFALYKENCSELQAMNTSMQEQLQFVRHPETEHVHLRGFPDGLAPEALAVVYWNKHERGAYLNIVNLPDPPPGKQYQLWADVEGEMVDMGVFEMTGKLQEMKFIANAESLNVTLEPKGGSKKPNVEQLYINGKV